MDRVKLYKINDVLTFFYDKNNTENHIGIVSHRTLKYRLTSFKHSWSYNPDIVLEKGHWRVDFPSNDDSRIYIFFDETIYIFSLSFIEGKPKIELISKYIDFDYSRPINIFMGCQGGGTSIVTKTLRYLDVNFGDDCGDKDCRKPHESMSFKVAVKMMSKDTPVFICRELFNQVLWSYGYEDNKINCVKLPNLVDKVTKISDVFPNIKFLSIIKQPNSFTSTTEGNKFKNKSIEEVMWCQRPLIEGFPLFSIDFYKFFSDFNYLNKVLRFIGSDNFINSESEFDLLKNKVGFDNKSLMK